MYGVNCGGCDMKEIKQGDTVLVDFVINEEIAPDGEEILKEVKRFKGCAVVDLVEDNRVFGRLPDGTPFMCGPEDVKVIPDVGAYCKSLDKALMVTFLILGLLILKLAGVI